MYGLDEAERADATGLGNFGERAVAIVAKQLTAIGVARCGFVADEEVDPPVVIEVKPSGCLRRMKRQKASLFSHVPKGAVAVVAQK